jgi:hypothetical protein
VKKLAAAVLIGVALFAARGVMKTYLYRLSSLAKKGQERVRPPSAEKVKDVTPSP